MTGSEERVPVVVVGTGFGGAVAACRLAQAGQQVVVLERGRRWGRGAARFPRDDPRKLLWAPARGPVDVVPSSEMVIVQGAGYGGGSLLYSNVHLRLPREGFHQGWPEGWSRETLDPYYDLVAHMLELTPIDEAQPLCVPPRTLAMEEAARRLGRGADVVRPPLALRLTTPEVPVQNRHGFTQSGCTHCAECSIGCNEGAKNSLDHNYLPLAERHGADVRTSCQVTALERDGDGYRVTYRRLAPRDGTEDDGLRHLVARTVVLAAGAVGTTELLLTSREALPMAGAARVGRGYSANGDLLSAGRRTTTAFDPTVGPAITAALRHSGGSAPGDPWFLVQDGAFPAAFGRAVLLALAAAARVESCLDDALAAAGGGTRTVLQLLERAFDGHHGAERELRSADADDTTEHVAVLLAMGRDSSDGVLYRREGRQRPGVEWSVTDNLELYETEQALCDDVVTRGLGGRPVHVPGWGAVRLPMSVHHLGGAVMAGDADHGVVDPHGEVFGCPGLHVLDGAAIPGATGVNPSHTIAAVAERNVERLVRRLTGNRRWVAPERASVERHVDPLPPTPEHGTPPVRAVDDVVLWAESDGELAGVGGGATHRVCLRLVLVGRAGPGSRLEVSGELTVDGLGPTREARVGRGAVRRDVGVQWRWTIHVRLGANPYVLEGWSVPGELRLALHRGLSPRNRLLAVGTLDLRVER